MIDNTAMFSLSYGLFVVTQKNGDRHTGCISNTIMQVTSNPNQIIIGLNKQTFTHELVDKEGVLNISVLDQTAPFALFERFGFASGRTVDKFRDFADYDALDNGLAYITRHAKAVLGARVTSRVDMGTHTLFIADVTHAKTLSDVPALTYQYYFDHIKPKPAQQKRKGYVCKICGYVYEGDPLPPDFICPVCKHGAAYFEPLA